VDPAIVSRVFQELSNAMAAFHGAVKIKEIPVPFALVHVQMMLLWFFNIFSPVAISIFVINFLDCDEPSGEGFSLPVDCASGDVDGKIRPAMSRTHAVIAMASSFIVVAGFTAMWLAANELEDPFGKDVTDIPMNDLHLAFCANLEEVLCNAWMRQDRWVVSTGEWRSAPIERRGSKGMFRVSTVRRSSKCTQSVPNRYSSNGSEPHPPATDKPRRGGFIQNFGSKVDTSHKKTKIKGASKTAMSLARMRKAHAYDDPSRCSIRVMDPEPDEWHEMEYLDHANTSAYFPDLKRIESAACCVDEKSESMRKACRRLKFVMKLKIAELAPITMLGRTSSLNNITRASSGSRAYSGSWKRRCSSTKTMDPFAGIDKVRESNGTIRESGVTAVEETTTGEAQETKAATAVNAVAAVESGPETGGNSIPASPPSGDCESAADFGLEAAAQLVKAAAIDTMDPFVAGQNSAAEGGGDTEPVIRSAWLEVGNSEAEPRVNGAAPHGGIVSEALMPPALVVDSQGSTNPTGGFNTWFDGAWVKRKSIGVDLDCVPRRQRKSGRMHGVVLNENSAADATGCMLQ